MANWKQICTTTGVLVLAGMLNSTSVLAQSDASSSLRVRKIEDRKLPDPNLRENNPGSDKADWYRVTTYYDTSSPWLDNLEITYYVLFQPDPRRAGLRTSAPLLLRGVGQYVNVKGGRHISEVYIHPNTIDRYGTPVSFGVVFKSEGRLLGTESTKGSPGWWQQLSPIDGLILNRAQTPYNPTSPDHYEASKAISVSGR